MSEFNLTIQNKNQLVAGCYVKKRLIVPINKYPLDDIYVLSVDAENDTAEIRIGEHGSFYTVPRQTVCDYINDGCYKCCNNF